MNVTVHIERLIITGLPLTDGDGDTLRTAVAAELTRLIVEGGIAPALREGGSLASLRGGQFRAAAGAVPARLGVGIANALYGGIGR